MAAGKWLWEAAFGKPGQAAGEKPVTAGAAEIGLAAAAISTRARDAMRSTAATLHDEPQ